MDIEISFADMAMCDDSEIITPITPIMNIPYVHDDYDIKYEKVPNEIHLNYEEEILEQTKERVKNFSSYIREYINHEIDHEIDIENLKYFIRSSDIDLEKYCYHYFDSTSTSEFFDVFCEIVEHCYHPKHYSFVFGKVLGYMIKYILDNINKELGNYVSGESDIDQAEKFEECLDTYKKVMIDLMNISTITSSGMNHPFTWKYGILYCILEPIRNRMTEFIFSRIDNKFVTNMKMTLSKYNESIKMYYSDQVDILHFNQDEINELREESLKVFTSLYLI